LLGLPGARNWKLFFHHRNGRLLNLDQPIASDDCKAPPPSDVDGSDNQTSPPSSTTTTTTTTASSSSSSSSSSSWETVPPLDDLDALLSEPADEEDQSVYDQELRHVFGDQWDNLVGGGLWRSTKPATAFLCREYGLCCVVSFLCCCLFVAILLPPPPPCHR
jgi:hypothetical protein